ncbi:hypothetical protein Nepgr_004664 [Nepenthes gracilis]|uniref:PROP1-like PPR domain-containing protein n=1 Tax=Nepenthes gracilis TaxID=150966 RepID=A0AAD3S1U2_NEPGR|nr:hypothetical protein Nepgr_004664 [Nepenthes gracilis]
MDAVYSPRSQALTLIPRPPSLSHSLSLSAIQSTHGQYLGCGHSLRLAGLRSRRRCKRLGIQKQIPRIRLVASLDLDSEPILVIVAMATLSAAAVVYLNYHSKRKKNVDEVDMLPSGGYAEEGRVTSKHGFDSLSLGIEALHMQHMIPCKQSLPEVEGSRPMDVEVVQLLLHETTSMHEDSAYVETLDLPNSSLHNQNASESPFYKKGEDVLLPIQEMVLESGAVSESQSGSCHKETELAVMFPFHKDEINGTSLVSVNDAIKEANNDETVKHDHGGLQNTSNNIYASESDRKELYLYYASNNNLHKEIEVSYQDIHLDNHYFSMPVRSNAPEMLQANHFSATGYIKGHRPLPHYKGGSSHERKKSGRGRGSTGGKEKGLPIQDEQKKLTVSTHQYGMRANGKSNPSGRFSSYNRLLRFGRLTECIELLEGMNREGILDMNKVYHAKFLDICRSQKAVEVAFRFVRLIPNPTLSTFNMLMSVCASAQDSEGAFQVQQLAQEAGFKADCKLYTTLISTCAKSGKVDSMFEVFNEMLNSGVEPTVHTYGALIDGCARAGQVSKAFGAYGILRSKKKVQPDRVVFNALITACGLSGVVDRAFDVVAEMRAESHPIDPDHVTVGALMKACTNAGQVDRVKEVYKMIHQYNIKGTPEVYTIAVNSCSQTGDWEFACSIYDDMKNNGVVPDEIFFSALIDVAGHAGYLDAAFEVMQDARIQRFNLGMMSYSSLMGACSNTKNWQKALQLYEDIKARNLSPTVETMNALITALSDGEQLEKAVEALLEMKKMGLQPNVITYSVLFVVTEKKDDLEVGLVLLSQAKTDGVPLNLVMCKCLIGMCSRRYVEAATLGEPIVSLESGHPQINSKWTSLALMIYRETIGAGVIPSIEVFSLVLGCLKLPQDASLKKRLIEILGVYNEASRHSNLVSLIDGFGEYDSRALSLLEEAASLGVVPCVSFKDNPIIINARNLYTRTAEVYLLTVFKGLKHRLAAGAKLPNITILLPVDTAQILSPKGERTINIAGRISQAVGALLRRLGLHYHGNESHGKIRISGLAVTRWFQRKLVPHFGGKQTELEIGTLFFFVKMTYLSVKELSMETLAVERQ